MRGALRSLAGLAALYPCGLFGQGQAPAPCLGRPAAERTYTRLRLMDVVRDQTPVRAEYLIRTCGVRVVFSADLEADLKEAGAEEKVIVAVRDVAPRPIVSRPMETGPAIAGEVRTNPRDGLAYVYVPAGRFRMGCGSGADLTCADDEKPAHTVEISKGFWLGQTEVTVAGFKRFSAATEKPMPGEPGLGQRRLNPGWSLETLPMNQVSWVQAEAYCAWAEMRLPTEAEWEYAARARTFGARYDSLDDVAWYANNSGNESIEAEPIWMNDRKGYETRLAANGNGPRAVRGKGPNRFQVFDMLGNLQEWTRDWYGSYPPGAEGQRDPAGPASGSLRVVRGGSWYDVATNVRASRREPMDPGGGSPVTGFRCAGTVPAR